MEFSIRLGKGVDDQELEALLANPKMRKREELVFKIANDGRNPATAGIKGMQLELPADSQILESSISDKNPQSIQVDITTQNLASGGRLLVVSFPPLKTGEFVTVKLSMSGAMPDVRNMKFLLDGDDQPHTIGLGSTSVESLSMSTVRGAPTGAPINAGLTFPTNLGATSVANPGLTPLESSQLAKAEPSTGTDSSSVSPIQQMNQSNSGVYFALAAILAVLALVLVALSAGLF
jgi:hypothetical protein